MGAGACDGVSMAPRFSTHEFPWGRVKQGAASMGFFRMKEYVYLGIISLLLFGVLIFNTGFGMRFHAFVLGVQPPVPAAGAPAQNSGVLAHISAAAPPARGFASQYGSEVEAPVFSNYPFNFKNQLTVGAGSFQGVAISHAVVVPATIASGAAPAPPPVLVGTVEKVFENASVIETIFDTRWNSAVRVGAGGADALLTGGLDPVVTLIPKDASVLPGDIVYSADAKFPYGLIIGEVKNVEFSSDRTSQRAELSLPYDLNKIRTVIVLTRNVTAQIRQ